MLPIYTPIYRPLTLITAGWDLYDIALHMQPIYIPIYTPIYRPLTLVAAGWDLYDIALHTFYVLYVIFRLVAVLKFAGTNVSNVDISDILVPAHSTSSFA